MIRFALAFALLLLSSSARAEELPRGWDPRPSLTLGASYGEGRDDLFNRGQLVSVEEPYATDDLWARSYFAQLEVPADRRVTFLAGYVYRNEDHYPESGFTRTKTQFGTASLALRLYFTR